MQLSLVCQDIHRMYTLRLRSRRSLITRQILFLNKIDLFAEKLPRSPLGDYFPDYTGGGDYNAACEYLLQRFVSLNQSAATKQIYAHYTCATDTNQIRCMYSYSSRKAFRSMMFISCIERNLGYPPTNPFAGMWSFVIEQGRSSLGTKAEHCRSRDKDPEDTKMEMPQCPYIFNVYLLILTPAYNAHSLVAASHIPFLSSSAYISALPIPPFILAQIALFRRGLVCKHYPGANDAAYSLTFIVLYSIMTL